jgi:hypothetical protein
MQEFRFASGVFVVAFRARFITMNVWDYGSGFAAPPQPHEGE